MNTKSPVELVCQEDRDLFYNAMPGEEELRQFTAKVKALQLDEFVKKLHENSIEMSELEGFKKLKALQEEPFKFDLQMLKQPTPSAKKTPMHVYSPAPKFGMPTELFKDCIKKDDRVPKLTVVKRQRQQQATIKVDDPWPIMARALGDADREHKRMSYGVGVDTRNRESPMKTHGERPLTNETRT